VTDEDVAAIEELGRQGGLFERLAASIAPEIFGMLDVKKVRLCLDLSLFYRDVDVCRVCCMLQPCSMRDGPLHGHKQAVAKQRCVDLRCSCSARIWTQSTCIVSAVWCVLLQALLLQMVGGVSQEFPGTGMKLRGDIHVCLMGDPGECRVY
jgi:hypothetical protein